jgi:hypothetical protein
MARANYHLALAETEEEKKEAQDAFIQAEKEHLAKLGVAFPSNTRAYILPATLIIVLLVTLLIGISTAKDTSGLTEQLARQSFETCLRTNDARAANIKDKRAEVESLKADRDGLRADIDFLRAVADGAPGLDAILDQKRAQIIAKERAITSKKVSIAESLAAVDDVAIAPGSPRVDCAKYA